MGFKSISLKMNVIAWLEFELGYIEVMVLHVSHYAMRILFWKLLVLDWNPWNHIIVYIISLSFGGAK